MNITLSLPETLEFNGVKVALADLTPGELSRLVAYVLPYGYGKTLQDSVAGVKKALEAYDAGKADDKATALAEPLREEYGNVSIESIIREEQASRIAAILDGTIGARGTRLTGEAAVRRQVLDKLLNAWLVANGKKLPKAAKGATEAEKTAVAEKVKAFKEKFGAKFADEIAAKVQEELAFAKGFAGDAGDDLELDL